MSTKVRIQMDDTQKILAKRCLKKNGQFQVDFTKECAKAMNSYIPYDTGRLKDMMVEIKTNQVIYNAPYARVQFYKNKGKGRQGTSYGGLRGKRWDIRAWQGKGDIILRKLSNKYGVRCSK